MITDGKGGAKSLASSEEGAITSTGEIGKHGKSKVVYDGPLRAVQISKGRVRTGMDISEREKSMRKFKSGQAGT